MSDYNSLTTEEIDKLHGIVGHLNDRYAMEKIEFNVVENKGTWYIMPYFPAPKQSSYTNET